MIAGFDGKSLAMLRFFSMAKLYGKELMFVRIAFDFFGIIQKWYK